MPTIRTCPNIECGHAEYQDDSDRTCTPEPMCPSCMKRFGPVMFQENEYDYEEGY